MREKESNLVIDLIPNLRLARQHFRIVAPFADVDFGDLFRQFSQRLSKVVQVSSLPDLGESKLSFDEFCAKSENLTFFFPNFRFSASVCLIFAVLSANNASYSACLVAISCTYESNACMSGTSKLRYNVSLNTCPEFATM